MTKMSFLVNDIQRFSKRDYKSIHFMEIFTLSNGQLVALVGQFVDYGPVMTSIFLVPCCRFLRGR